jgi:hypothetical protein
MKADHSPSRVALRTFFAGKGPPDLCIGGLSLRQAHHEVYSKSSVDLILSLPKDEVVAAQ